MSWLSTGVDVLLIICVSVPVLGSLLIFLLARFSKIAVCAFAPTDEHELDIPPYVAAIASAARTKGCSQIGIGRNTEHRAPNIAILMLSSDSRVLVLIWQGRIFGLLSRKTLLISQLSNGGALITHDELSVPEVDPKTCRQLLINANFDELLDLHEDGLKERAPFREGAGWHTLEEVFRRRARRMVDSGMACFVDGEKDYFRYSARAGFWMATFGLLAAMFDPQVERRGKIKRPETRCPKCGYDIRATRDRCPECGHHLD